MGKAGSRKNSESGLTVPGQTYRPSVVNKLFINGTRTGHGDSNGVPVAATNRISGTTGGYQPGNVQEH